MKGTADRLLGGDYIWSVLGAGRHQLNPTTMGAIMGSNVRILTELSLDVATPHEARQILGLKGKENVGF